MSNIPANTQNAEAAFQSSQPGSHSNGILNFTKKFSFRLPAVIVSAALIASTAIGIAGYVDA
ncbi:MAG: hypothetical protein ACI9MJ_000962, partial [Alphaproteobacteria bacterium]